MLSDYRAYLFATTMLVGGLQMAAADEGSRAEKGLSNAHLRGSYAWTLEGSFAGTNLVAINQFTADGAGTFSGERTINSRRRRPANDLHMPLLG